MIKTDKLAFRCIHRHSAESHPKCYEKYIAGDLSIKNNFTPSRSGNGGGGGGGVVVVYYRNVSGSGVGLLSASAGAAGVGGNSGSSGTSGTTASYSV